jgi:DNA polymerase III subunit epsilon
MTVLRNAGSMKIDKEFNMREIVIDAETTGFDPLNGHRIVEIGAVELINRSLAGQMFHCYLHPERSIPADALAVHGLSAEFLADKPLFAAVVDEFLAFVGDAPLVAYSAGFDIAFLNSELTRIAKPPIAVERVIDTLVLARRKHAGGLTLDGVDRSRRSKHVALLDAELLAAVHMELTTTRQTALQLEQIKTAQVIQLPIAKRRPQSLAPRVTADDRNAHREFVRTLGSDAVWLDYFTIKSVAA